MGNIDLTVWRKPISIYTVWAGLLVTLAWHRWYVQAKAQLTEVAHSKLLPLTSSSRWQRLFICYTIPCPLLAFRCLKAAMTANRLSLPTKDSPEVEMCSLEVPSPKHHHYLPSKVSSIFGNKWQVNIIFTSLRTLIISVDHRVGWGRGLS